MPHTCINQPTNDWNWNALDLWRPTRHTALWDALSFVCKFLKYQVKSSRHEHLWLTTFGILFSSLRNYTLLFLKSKLWDITFKFWGKKNLAHRNQTAPKTGHSFTKEAEGYSPAWKWTKRVPNGRRLAAFYKCPDSSKYEFQALQRESTHGERGKSSDFFPCKSHVGNLRVDRTWLQPGAEPGREDNRVTVSAHVNKWLSWCDRHSSAPPPDLSYLALHGRSREARRTINRLSGTAWLAQSKGRRHWEDLIHTGALRSSPCHSVLSHLLQEPK